MGWAVGILLLALLIVATWILFYGVARLLTWLVKSPDPFPGLSAYRALIVLFVLRRFRRR